MLSFSLLTSLSFSQVGVVVGMVIFGLVADRLGRRLGSITTNVLMLLGAIFLTAASPAPFPDGNRQQCDQFFWWIAVSYFVFGVGVGGEYPLSASIASERTMTSSDWIPTNCRRVPLEELHREARPSA